MKKFISKYKIEILAISITLLIFMLSCAYNKIFPFGQNNLSRYDGFYQYPGFTAYFRSVLLGKNNLFYSFKGLLGYNFYATSIYYLINPTSIFSVFFDNAHLMEYYNFIVVLRIVLCSFTMSKFLKYKFKDAKNNKDIYMIIFSVAYSLMAYNVCYFFNYMYFDTVVLFPLVMIGLEKLIHENNSKMYIICLTISIISNFYIGFMVCIFSLLYFIYNYILLKNKDKRIIKKFIISSLLCGGMCAIILLPVVYELLQGKAVLYSDPIQTNYFAFNLNFLNIIYKFTPGSMTTYDIKYGTVNIYASLLVLVLVVKYFYNEKFSVKEKLVTGGFILFFLISISFNLIDYAWHLMQCPIWYPNRYIFMFSFFLIFIACKSLINIDSCKMSYKDNMILCGILIMSMVIPALNAFFYQSTIKIICAAFGIVLLAEYMFLINNKKAWVLLLCFFFTEIILNTSLSINQLSINKTISTYKIENSIYEEKINNIKSIEDNDNNFYRMELSSIINYNSGASYNYNGVNLFSSLRNGRIMDLFEYYLGYKVSNKSNLSYNFRNPYINSIISLKYLTGNDNETYYENLHFNNNGGFALYKNKDALSLGFMVDDDVFNHKFIKNKPLDNIKEIVNTMTGEEKEVYNYPHRIDNDIKYEKTRDANDQKKVVYNLVKNGKDPYVLYEGVASEDGFFVINENVSYFSKVKILLNNIDYSSITSNSTSLFINKGVKYSIKFTPINLSSDAEVYDVSFYKYNDYIDFITKMKENELTITEYKTDNHIKGEINVNKDKKVLFTTIPYDKGWSVKVDGKKVSYKDCYNSFICLELDEGKHNIELKYIPVGFIIGSSISAVCLILAIIYIKKKK